MIVRNDRARAVAGILVACSLPNAFSEALIHIVQDSGAQFVYGVLKLAVGLVGSLALWNILRSPYRALGWLRPWAAGVALLAGAAPVVFGGAKVLPTGLLSFGGAGMGLVVGLLAWRRWIHLPVTLEVTSGTRGHALAQGVTAEWDGASNARRTKNSETLQ